MGGELDFYADFTFVSSVEGIEGKFSNTKQCVQSGNSIKTELTISGMPDKMGFTNIGIGSVSVTLTLNSYTRNWNVGDTVTWYGEDGNAYECQVLSKNSSNYVLITTKSVANYKKNTISNMISWVASVGARFPQSTNSAENEFVNNIVNAMTTPSNGAKINWIPVNVRGTVKYYGKYMNGQIKDYSSSGLHSEAPINVYLVFDVPIS